jgi:hypothetical protein
LNFGIACTKLIRSRSVVAEALSGTRRGPIRLPQPRLRALQQSLWRTLNQPCQSRNITRSRHLPGLIVRYRSPIVKNLNSMKKSVHLFALPALAFASILAPSSAHALSFPIYFPSQTGGFSSPFATPPGSTNASASFSGPGIGTTESFNPFANGVTSVQKLTFGGTINYTGTPGSGIFLRLLSNGSQVESFQIASGNTALVNEPFSYNFTNATNANIDSDLAFQFEGIGNLTSTHPSLRVVHEVPGPLPILGAAAAFSYSRKLRKSLKASKPEVISTTEV